MRTFGGDNIFRGSSPARHIYVDVATKLAEKIQFSIVADFESLKKKWRVKPRSVELGDVHAQFQIVRVNLYAVKDH